MSHLESMRAWQHGAIEDMARDERDKRGKRGNLGKRCNWGNRDRRWQAGHAGRSGQVGRVGLMVLYDLVESHRHEAACKCVTYRFARIKKIFSKKGVFVLVVFPL